ncbi:hypothetical protein SH668x_000607 [Planctomicrobium sp. SH668]|uniref:hypothetical protein n=1 Tax=Planctomicrobium sp. SH668 TaxID=3448126 RepID=UPI003F5BC09D
MPRTYLLTIACLIGAIAALSAAPASAQDNSLIFDHRSPVGVAGRIGALTKPGHAGTPQPVQVRLPSTGNVTFFVGSPQNGVTMPAPAQVSMGMGYAYRFRVSDMPEYPGVELFPSVELVDRLHAPAGLAEQFPIPLDLTADEIEIVLQDRMVTKVVYLEDPNRAFPFQQGDSIRLETLKPNENLMQAADVRGRPLAIIRIGGRIPDVHSTTDEFFSQSPLVLPGK